MVSRITGFGRIAVAAAVLGPTYFGNLFQFSSLVPFLVFGLLSGSLIPAILVPPLVQRLGGGDKVAAARLAGGFLGVLLVIFAGVMVAGMLATPLLVRIMAVAVEDDRIRDEQLRLGLPMMAMMFPQLLFYSLSAVSTAVQHAHGRFALPAGVTAVENLGATAVVGVSALLFGMGAEIQDVSLAHALLLGLGTTMAVGLSASVQWWAASRAGIRLVPSRGWRDPAIRAMFRTGASSVGYTCLSIAGFFGMLTVASRVPGGVAAFQITHSFIQLPVALAAGSLAAVQLPRLAQCFQEGQLQEFRATYRCAVRLVLFALLPGSLLLVAIAPALAQASAFGKMATPFGVSLIAACVAGRGLGALGEAILVVGTSASYARQDPAAPLRAMILMVSVSGTGMVLASTMSNGPALILTLAAAATAASSVAALYLHRCQLRSLETGRWRDLRESGADLAAALMAAGPAWLIVHHMASLTGGPWRGMQVAAAAMLIAALVYLALQFLRGSDEMALLLPLPQRLRQSLNRRRAARTATCPPFSESTHS